MTLDANAKIPQDALSRLVSIALSRPDLSVLSEMLLEVARQLDAHGCALWQMEPRLPGMRVREEKGDDKIIAIAAGFVDRLHYPEHDLMSEVPSGVAMKTGLAQRIANFSGVPVPERATAWLSRTGVKSLCSVRVQLDENRAGALTVYRQRTGEWSEGEVRLLEYFAVHIPALYRTVRDRVSFRILEEVSTILRKIEEYEASPEAVQTSVHKVCQAVASGFQCLETAIYLERLFAVPSTLDRANNYPRSVSWLYRSPWAAESTGSSAAAPRFALPTISPIGKLAYWN